MQWKRIFPKKDKYFKFYQFEYFNILQLLSISQLDHTLWIQESNYIPSVIN
jgi:hypothetical protein